jgi:ABC-type Na+ transport system ATPase subunit NatA
MRYDSFRIRNFKGIKDTLVRLETVAGASVFAFVGLNESGKTTVLEAIHSFAPDEATSELLGGEEGLGVPFKDRVPRHLLSEFTGGVCVTATLSVSNEDKKELAKILKESIQLQLNIEEFPDYVVLEREQKFENGDFKKSFFTIMTEFKVKSPGQKKWRDATVAEHTVFRDVVFGRAPRIAYFPTFVFEFPKSIYLTERGGLVDRFYRTVFQDILDYDGRGQNIEKDIVRRVRREAMNIPWVSFWASWVGHDDRDKIQQVMDRASAAVTKLIFGRWNKIFGEEARGKEVLITYEVVEGEVTDSKGVKTNTNEHDIQIKFQVKDGTRRFDVNDRSLGFRWFFSFMMFTQFRVARANAGAPPLVFIFDEPAANLHAAAQQKLIESFPEIAQNGHVLAYSTHSHYMIEPKWLEQTYIVTNRADAPGESMLDEISLDDESLDIKVESYRSFVDSHPNQTSYFQPILDRLEVVPSKFDWQKPSVVLEGKSDYYVLRYAERMIDGPKVCLLPGLGAGTFGSLAALSVGWNLNFVFLLDGDKQGNIELDRYAKEFGIPKERLVTLEDLVSEVKTIEDLLDEEAMGVIQGALDLSGAPTKAQIRRFFQERLASDNVEPLGATFGDRARQVLDGLHSRLET